jgi:hypothetical protein
MGDVNYEYYGTIVRNACGPVSYEIKGEWKIYKN